MNEYDVAKGLLWTLPAVAAAAFVVVLLILRWVLVAVTWRSSSPNQLWSG